MVSLRHNVWISCDAQDVWQYVTDPSQLPRWFTGVQTARVEGDRRYCTLTSGVEVVEQLVNVDEHLRRLQYRVLSGLAVQGHLATVDVLEVSPGKALVVYGADVEPATIAAGLNVSIEKGVARLKQLLEADAS